MARKGKANRPKTKQVSIGLSDAVIAALDQRARGERRTRSQLAAILIEGALASTGTAVSA